MIPSFKIEPITDSICQDYMVLNVSDKCRNNIKWANSWLKYSKSCYNDDIIKKLERDRGMYHVTVFNSMECKHCPELLKIKADITDLELLGIGGITKDLSYTYYIICKSKQLDKLRNDLGLKQRHFHITLAFNHKDLHHIDKNEQTLIKGWEELELGRHQ